MIIAVDHNKQVIHRPQKMDLWENRSVFLLHRKWTLQKIPTSKSWWGFNNAAKNVNNTCRFKIYTWKSLSVATGKYIRPRSLLMWTSTPIFSLTSSAAVCSNPVGTVAPMVTVMMVPGLASFSVGGGSTVSEPCPVAASSREAMLYSKLEAQKRMYDWTCHSCHASHSHVTPREWHRIKLSMLCVAIESDGTALHTTQKISFLVASSKYNLHRKCHDYKSINHAFKY